MESNLTSMWVNFFTTAGIPSDVAATYALTFTENRIQNDMLLDLNKEYLRDMGIIRMGDVIAILRHAKQVHENTARDRVLSTTTTAVVTKVPVAAVTGRATVTQPSSPSRILERYTRNPQVQDASPKNVSTQKRKSTDSGIDNEAVIKKSRLIRFGSPTPNSATLVKDGASTNSNKQTVFARLGSSESVKALPQNSVSKLIFSRLGTKSDDMLEEPVVPLQKDALKYEGILKANPLAKRVFTVTTSKNNIRKIAVGTMRADEAPVSVKEKLAISKAKSVKFSNHIEYKEIESNKNEINIGKKIIAPKPTSPLNVRQKVFAPKFTHIFNKPERRLSMPEGVNSGVKSRLVVRGLFDIRAFPMTPHRSAAPAFSQRTSLAMGSKAILILTWCLSLNDAFGEDVSKGTSGLKDSSVKTSASRLYRNIPVSVYASSSPYAAYSFHVPNIISAPKNTRVIPVNEGSFVIQTPNGDLKDSYGNKFAGSPQGLDFKTTFPQQFVQLQDLPAHLSQPLVSNLHYQQTTPHFFAPAQFSVQRFQASSPAPFARYAEPQLIAENANIRDFAASPFQHTNYNPHPVSQQQQQSRNKAIFVNTRAHQQNNRLRNEPKLQRLQETPKENVASNHQNPQAVSENSNYNDLQHFRVAKQEHQVAPAKVTAYVNGKKTEVTLQTNPPLPLLDISLLEPLTFDNPLVPQVQHFLPRINDATYHKLPDYNVHVVNKKQHDTGEQQTRSYHGELVKDKAKTKNKSPKRKEKKPQLQNDNENKHIPPSITVKGVPNVSPEYSYEINSPNYKETYKEQVVSYNKETQSEPVTHSYNKVEQADPIHYSYKKETQSEPVNYTYEKQVHNEPVHYSYAHNSNSAPKEEKQIYYQNEGQGPKHLVYTIKSADKNTEQNSDPHRSPQSTSGESQEYSSEDDTTGREKPINHNIEHENYADAPHQLIPEHRQEEHHQHVIHDDVKVNNDFPKSFMDIINAQANYGQFQPITPDYNKDESVLPTHKPNERIRVDPNQHIKRPQLGRPSNARDDGSPNQHIHEKMKRVIIRDETPEGVHSHNEKQSTETVDQEENNEENFEKAYKNAAFGFPAYEYRSEDIEKDIYNPETYGVHRDDNNFDNEHIPFEQYYAEGDKFPKFTHSNYKDGRDKVKEDYYLDFSINKPESVLERHKNKVAYYKMYNAHRPEKIFSFNQNGEKEGKNAKFTVAPAYLFNYATEQKPKHQQFARIQIPPFEEFDYEKEAPRDSTAYGSHLLQRSRTKTQFVEPQFQYGFEPLSNPHLLDSELATMASNDSPESEKPGSRKKLYKENWYIKKTTTSGGNAGS
ncbi:unnamed protein product, partial [Iphiclides podalirius]